MDIQGRGDELAGGRTVMKYIVAAGVGRWFVIASSPDLPYGHRIVAECADDDDAFRIVVALIAYERSKTE